MSYWHFFAGVGALLNDFLAVISVIGPGVRLFSPSRANSFVLLMRTRRAPSSWLGDSLMTFLLSAQV